MVDDPAMRRVCSLAFLAACTFGSPRASVDSSGGGGDDAADGPWDVAETLTVPVDKMTATSKTVLEAGVGYRLRATGTFSIGFQLISDAEYFGFNRGAPMDTAANIDVGLAVNDSTIDLDRTPRWGDYNLEHVYEVPWMGDGGPIVAQFHDGNYMDNFGTLTLEILKRR
jgi:hypothetical protein